MNAITKKIAIAVLALCACLAPAAQADAAAAPAWRFDVSANPTNFVPGTTYGALGGNPSYLLLATNVGGAPTSGPVTITSTLPAGITLSGVANAAQTTGNGVKGTCTSVAPAVTCVIPGSVQPGQYILIRIGVNVDGTGTILHEGDVVVNQATLSGGGTSAVVASSSTTISATIAPFGFLPGTAGFGSTPYAENGSSETTAGAHPHILSVNLGFTSRKLGPRNLGSIDGGVREIEAFLPHGMIVNPTATPVFCTEVQLEGFACPPAAQVGRINVAASVLLPVVGPVDLYNMTPSPGKPATFGFNFLGFPIHIEGKLRSGDYTIGAESKGIPGLFAKPGLGTQLLLWGDPSSSRWDLIRGSESFEGDCGHLVGEVVPCPVTPRDTPFLTMPTSCAEEPIIEAAMSSWNHPNDWVERSDVMRDANSNPVGITDCAGLDFAPTLKARPTTNVADSPSGLEVDLEVPQTNSLSERATAHLRKAVVSLPEGMTLNPASANGLESCSSTQIGIDSDTGVANGNPVTCPDASRVGSVEVDTALLDHPLPGSVFVATPYDNPFDSLLAIYLVIDDPSTGTLVKFPGHVTSDPQTGRLVTTFDDSPQLPFSNFRLTFFGGAHGVLRTPAVCGEYSTTSSITPWSAPDSGPPAEPHDDYSIATPPSGGSCAAAGDQPNSPSFDAGVVSPIAKSHTPFVLHLRRADGTQQFSSFSTKLPPGLTGRLVGVGQCSDAALVAAAAKSGDEEQASPSCPASSHLGSVVAGAGSGPSPYYAHGDAYLAGPYKGGPLSIAVVTPAVAGPYDLGTVVVRAALRLDPESGQITAVSDEIPTILQGIPLDVRTVDIKLDRPNFTLTGTSCDPSAVEGSLTSILGQVSPLSSRFQLGECAGLPFKPKLGIRLFGGTKRGGHPALRGALTMPEGGANIAETSVALPRSEFLDQAHIGTVCTRVQFAEGDGNGSNCPAASVYGSAVATSPLVDYALDGPAILRSSDNELPDLVFALRGPPSQPIAVNVVGRIDSVKGGIRTTFEGVPDLPVSTFVISMQGGKKGLLQNSTNICKGKHKATALFEGQNGKTLELRPALRNGKCPKKSSRYKRRAQRHSRTVR